MAVSLSEINARLKKIKEQQKAPQPVNTLPTAQQIKAVSKLVDTQGVNKAGETLLKTNAINLDRVKLPTNDDSSNKAKAYINQQKVNNNISKATNYGLFALGKLGTGTAKGVEDFASLGAGITGAGTSGLLQLLGNKNGAKKASDFYGNVVRNTHVTSNFLNNAVNTTYGKNAGLKDAEQDLGGQIAGISGQILPLLLNPAKAVTKLPTATSKLGGAVSKIGNLAKSTLPMAGQTAGQGITEATNDGANIIDATKYGALQGALTVPVTAVTGVAGVKGNQVVSKLLPKVSSPVGKTAVKVGNTVVDMANQGAINSGITALSPALKRATYDPNSKNATKEDLLNSFVLGFGTSGLSKGLNKINTLPDIQNKIKSGEKLTTEESNIVKELPKSEQTIMSINNQIQAKTPKLVSENTQDTNVMTSAYGRNNYDEFMKKNIEDGKLLYDIDQGIINKKSIGDRLQLPMNDTLYNNSILQNKQNINTLDTNIQKNIKNNVKTILPTAKDTVLPTAKITENNAQQMAPNLKTAKLLENRPSLEKPSLKTRIEKGIMVDLVNKGHYIDKLAKSSGNKELKFKYDQMLASQGEGQNTIGKAQTNNDGIVIGKSLNDVWKPVEKSGKAQQFSDYLLQKHNIDRMSLENNALKNVNQFELEHPELAKIPKTKLQEYANAKETDNGMTILSKQYLDLINKYENTSNKSVFGENITAEDSAKKVAEYEKTNPEFVEWSNDINKYNQNNMQNMVDAGLTSEETQKLLNETYSNYVRIQRDIAKGNSPMQYTQTGVKVRNPIQTAKGGSQNIKPLKDSMAEQTLQIKNAIRRNLFGKELLKTTGGTLTDTVNIDNVVSEKSKDKPNTFTVFEKGQPVTIELNDELFNAIKPTVKGNWENNILLKPIKEASKLQRSLITDKNLLFTVTNFAKDFHDGLFNSKYSTKFIPNYAKGLVEMLTNSKRWQQYMGLGGSSNTFFDYETGLKKESKGVGKVFDQISKINNVVEQAPRFAEFLSTLEAGKSTSEAMYNAAEVTINFKRGGDIAKAINRNGANFFNASIQGFDKTIRNFTEAEGAKDYIKLLSKVAVLGITPAIINHLLLDDDKDYQKLNDRDKDANFIFPIGDGKFIKIPKGRMMSVFGASARAVLESAKGNNEALSNLPKFAENQIAPTNPLESNILSPIIGVSNNKSWSGSDIVPQRLQNLPKGMQTDENTSSLASTIGGATNTSPKNIDYLIKQYSGVVGQFGLPLLTPKSEQNPVASKFVIDSVLSNKTSDTFYNKIDELTKQKNAEKLTKGLEDGTSTLTSLQASYLNSQSSKISDLYAEKRKIELSGISGDSKKNQTREIQEQINQIEENSLKKIANKSYQSYLSQVSEIDNDKSLKDTEGAKTQAKGRLILNSNFSDEQKKDLFNDMLTKNQKEKVAELENKGIDTLIASGYTTVINNIQGDKYTNEKGKLETVDGSTMGKKATAINKLNISDKQKDILLQTAQPNSDNPVTYNDIKTLTQSSYQTYFALTTNQRADYKTLKTLGVTESGLNAYYKNISKIEGQKDANGETISGSKKSAVAQYINSLPLKANQKILLFVNAGYDTAKYKTEIFNYINSLKISTSEKKAMWKSLGYK